MISVYVAAPYSAMADAKKLRDALARRGIGCTSRWLELETSSEDPEDMRRFARLDRYDVRRAQAVVMWNPADYRDRGTGGRHVETGIAFALSDMPVILVGVKSNIFVHLPEATLVPVPASYDLVAPGAWEAVAMNVAHVVWERCLDFGSEWDSPVAQAAKGVALGREEKARLDAQIRCEHKNVYVTPLGIRRCRECDAIRGETS